MSTRRSFRVRQVAVAGVLVLMTVTACSDDSALEDDPSASPSEDGSATSTSPPEAAELEEFYQQDVDWADCTGGECGTAMVPLDYEDPTGATVTLALKRIPATGDPVGTIFVNPGGPGGSGIDFADQFSQVMRPEVLESYDVIGFDPRGVGESEPVDCLDDEQLGEFIATDPDPETPEEIAEFEDVIATFTRGCEANTGELLAHVSTIEVAQDLDVLRGVVGDEQLTYFGASYGTSIGSTYAELFPESTGRLVLDGSTDPTLTAEAEAVAQAAGFQTALYAYIEDCQTDAACPLAPGREQAAGQIGELLDQLDAEPLPTGDPERPLTEQLGIFGIGVTLYDEAAWEALTPALEQAFSGQGTGLLQLSDVYFKRNDDGAFTDNSAEVISAVNCLDDPAVLSVEEIEASIPEFTEASPVFGRALAWSQLTCSEWPVESSYEPLEIRAEGAEPILVIGTTRDPATPYEWSVAMAEELESGVLLTREGDGHTAFGAGNTCVDEAVDAFLLDGTVPENGLEC